MSGVSKNTVAVRNSAKERRKTDKIEDVITKKVYP